MHCNHQRQRQAYKVPPASEPWLGLILWMTAASARKAGAASKSSTSSIMPKMLLQHVTRHVHCCVDAMFVNMRVDPRVAIQVVSLVLKMLSQLFIYQMVPQGSMCQVTGVEMHVPCRGNSA